jgi:diguanylate cyclase (GGDEF)-like protein
MKHHIQSIQSEAQGDVVRRVILPISAILGLLAVLLISVTLYSSNRMDGTTIERHQALINNALSVKLEQSLSELRSVAWWDDMVIKSRSDGLDKEWLDIEVGVFVTTSYNHDRILILDEDNLPVYGFGDDKRLTEAQQTEYSQAMQPLVAQIRGGKNVSPRISDNRLLMEQRENSKITDRLYGRGAAALIAVKGKPVLASVMAITPSIDMKLNAARPRLLVSMIDVTPEVLAALGKSVLIKDLTPAGKAPAKAGVMTLESDSAVPLGRLEWTPEKPGQQLTWSVLPLILAVLAAIIWSLRVLFLRLFSSAKLLQSREEQAQHLANHDALTSLPNRRYLERELFKRSGRFRQDSIRLACAIIDLDRFKDINDTLGHAAGDALITQVAKSLEKELRPNDFVARLGGDEFAVLRECGMIGDVEDLSKSIASIFAAPFPVMGHQLEASASVGISVSALDRTVEDLMREADIALYEAKAKQKGSTVRFAPAMASKIEQRRALEVDLKSAIANGGLSMAYQPIINAATGMVTSVEALVRWHCPKHGMVPPDVFVAIAEETGMMADLGRFVIQQAISDSRAWPNVTTAINISPAQLRSASIVNDLMQPAREAGVSPTKIGLEITETVLMANDLRTMRTLNILKDHGFSLALDDFGSGYSSLAYVRDFPFDKLKIDRSFVKGQNDTGRSLDIVKAVVNFGRILGREVVAEGIETEQEMQAMQAAGVTHLQGFLFSKPLTAPHIEALIATGGRLTATRIPGDAQEEPSSAVGSLPKTLRQVA